MGVGNLLFRDEGLGIHVIERLEAEFDFPEHVSLVDGGTLGLSLLGVVTAADHLIIVDAVRKGGEPGTLYRMAGEDLPYRVMAKNSLHQVDFIEAFTCCQLLDKVPETVILGLEPLDIETLSIELTPTIRDRVDFLVDEVLSELDRLGAGYRPKGEVKHVSSHTCQDHRD